MKYTNQRTAIRVDKLTLAPLDPVPVKLHHRLLYQLALEMFGHAAASGRRLSKSLKASILRRLKNIRAEHLGDRSWDTTLEHAVNNAYEATREGRNNLYRYHSQTEASFYTFHV